MTKVFRYKVYDTTLYDYAISTRMAHCDPMHVQCVPLTF